MSDGSETRGAEGNRALSGKRHAVHPSVRHLVASFPRPFVPSTRLLTPLVSSFFLHSFRAGGDWKETTSRERDEGTAASEEMTDGSQR